jgi:hypothetical protein
VSETGKKQSYSFPEFRIQEGEELEVTGISEGGA